MEVQGSNQQVAQWAIMVISSFIAHPDTQDSMQSPYTSYQYEPKGLGAAM